MSRHPRSDRGTALAERPAPPADRDVPPATVAAAASLREAARCQLRRLDACLDALENAHLGGARTLSGRAVARLAPLVPDLSEGMLISDAIEHVLGEQEPWLERVREAADLLPARRRARLASASPPLSAALLGVPVIPRPTRADTSAASPAAPAQRPERRPQRAAPQPAAAPLDASDARALTDRVREGAAPVWELLLEASEGRAWAALSYPTWEEYVRAELPFSRQRSFQLLDHGRFMRALQAVTGGAPCDAVPERASRDLKRHWDAVLEAVRVRVEGLPGESVEKAVVDVVRDQRHRLAAQRRALTGSPGEPAGAHLSVAPPPTDVPTGELVLRLGRRWASSGGELARTGSRLHASSRSA